MAQATTDGSSAPFKPLRPVLSSDTAAVAEIDETTNKRLLRKIDWKVMPVLCATYAMQYYGKAIVSQASVFGLERDLGLEGGLKYPWVSVVFYFGYILGSYPISLMAQQHPPRIVITAVCVTWAAIVISSPVFTSYGGIMYTHSEQVLRSSFWSSSSGASLLLIPIIDYGIGHIPDGLLHSWQYMYLIAGGCSLLWGTALFFIFPGTLHDARGFTPDERKLLLERVKGNNAGAENRQFKAYQLREALLDYQLWGIVTLSAASSAGSGVLGAFGPILFSDMGFSRFSSLLLSMPIGALSCACVLGSGYLGRTIPNSRLYIIAVSCFPVMIGCGLIWALHESSHVGRIAGFYMINFFGSAWVQCIGLGTSNVAGHTKKAVYAAGTFMGNSVGNIIGPMLFDAKWAPRYKVSFIGIMMCFTLCFSTALALRYMLASENQRRERDFGPPETSHGLQDLTDRENKSFRYNL
ncbi:hypothetical protein E4U41_002978 [Claviceps citrina]|nr:hypothetical protein E4U41_002978 [Claviceps citrina]